jgi:hypothetical protein
LFVFEVEELPEWRSVSMESCQLRASQ